MAEATLLSRIRELEARIAALEGGYSPAPDLIYNVRAFGAEGDGVTDDTAAIQATLNAAKAAGGGVIYIPDGLYLMDAITLTNANHITIQGAGPGRTILKAKPNATNAPVLQFVGCNRLTVRDLEIDGDKANQAGTHIRGLRWRASTAASGGVLCEHGTFERLYIHDVTESGLVIAGGRWAKISKVHTERCGSTGNLGVGIHISNDSPDISLLSCDVQISDCSDDGSGLDGGDEGGSLQLQANTHDIQVTNYISRNATKYGVKCQANNVELANIKIYEPGVSGIALQYNDVRATNLRVEHTTSGVVTGIGIGVPQQEIDPRDVRMDLSNIHIVGRGFYHGIEVSNTQSGIDPAEHVHISNVNIKASVVGGITTGLYVRGNLKKCSFAHIHATDCATNISQGGYVIDGAVYAPRDITYIDVHSEESLGPGTSGNVGWNCGYGFALLIGCTSERLEGSSRVLWQNLNQNWGLASAQRVGWCGTALDGTPVVKISGDAVAVGRASYLELNAESGGTDNLTDLTGGVPGQMVVLRAYYNRTITIVHNSAKIILPGGVNYTLSGDKRLLLCCIAPGKWTVLNA